MTCNNRYAVGDDIEVTFDLLLNGEPFPANAVTTTVKAAIAVVGAATLATGTAVVTCSKDALTPQRVTAKFPHSATGSIVPGTYEIEAQIEDASVSPTKVYTCDRSRITIFAGVIPQPS